jgi:DNA repair photolyase
MNKTSGTKEWADSNINWAYGCSHNCRYCYAKFMALRFKRIEKEEDWSEMKINEDAINKSYSKRQGRIMMPTSHDITPEILEPSLRIIKKVLQSGNEILLTTKPHLECIKAICEEFEQYKKQIQFRFTIGSYASEHFEIWEPGAPDFFERRDSLKFAYENGYKTSISAEPLLTKCPWKLIASVQKYVTESIWFGTMNHVRKLPESIPYHTQKDNKIIWIHDNIGEIIKEINKARHFAPHYLINNKIKFKDSIKNRVTVNGQCLKCSNIASNCSILQDDIESNLLVNSFISNVKDCKKFILQKEKSTIKKSTLEGFMNEL